MVGTVNTAILASNGSANPFRIPSLERQLHFGQVGPVWGGAGGESKSSQAATRPSAPPVGCNQGERLVPTGCPLTSRTAHHPGKSPRVRAFRELRGQDDPATS